MKTPMPGVCPWGMSCMAGGPGDMGDAEPSPVFRQRKNKCGRIRPKKLSFGCSVSKERKQRLGSDSKLVEKET